MKRTNLYLTSAQMERLKGRSEKEGLSLAELVRRAVDAFLAWDDPTSAPNPSRPIRNGALIPRLKDLILTHIFEKDLDKRIDKAEVLLISTIRVALPGSFAKLICKMWVRIRHERRGLSRAGTVIIFVAPLTGMQPSKNRLVVGMSTSRVIALSTR